MARVWAAYHYDGNMKPTKERTLRSTTRENLVKEARRHRPLSPNRFLGGIWTTQANRPVQVWSPQGGWTKEADKLIPN